VIELLRRRNFALLWWGGLIPEAGEWFLCCWFIPLSRFGSSMLEQKFHRQHGSQVV